MSRAKEQVLVMCRDCAYSHEHHELTAFEPMTPFLCRCPFRQWSQFLDIPQVCSNFKSKQKQQ